MFPFRKTAARTSLRRGSNPARSTCVNLLNRYRAEIFALPFCAFCAFLRLFLSLPYLSAFGLKPWAVLYSRFAATSESPLWYGSVIKSKPGNPAAEGCQDFSELSRVATISECFRRRLALKIVSASYIE
jgi:hypothetical protein